MKRVRIPNLAIPCRPRTIQRLVCLGLLFGTGCTSSLTHESNSTNASGIVDSFRNPFQNKPPVDQKNWRPDLAIQAYAEFQGKDVLIKHVRDCRYRSESDYDVRHYDLRFTLNDVKSVDFLIVPFRETPLLAHTMLSFGLQDGRHFIISVEARLGQGQTYTAAAGTGKNFELIYVIGDERDLIPLRTIVRKVDVYLYRGRATPQQAQDLLVDMLDRANKLQRSPEYYETISNNCTTNIVNHINKLRPGEIPFDLRTVLPGHSDRLAYELGLLEIDGPFEPARQRARITELANRFAGSEDFSSKIRQPP